MPRHQLTVLKTVEVSRTGRHCEPDQNLFARGAYTESDKPPARKSGLATRDYLSTACVQLKFTGLKTP